MSIRRKVGEAMAFTGGAEDTPGVEVATFFAPGSLNHGEKNFLIRQNGRSVSLSPATMRSILAWGEKE